MLYYNREDMQNNQNKRQQNKRFTEGYKKYVNYLYI